MARRNGEIVQKVAKCTMAFDQDCRLAQGGCHLLCTYWSSWFLIPLVISSIWSLTLFSTLLTASFRLPALIRCRPSLSTPATLDFSGSRFLANSWRKNPAWRSTLQTDRVLRLVYTYDASTSTSASISHVWTGTRACACVSRPGSHVAYACACVVRVNQPLVCMRSPHLSLL